MKIQALEHILSDTRKASGEGEAASTPIPILFVGHGSPMNAIETNRYTEEWARIGRGLPVPKAILSISAHWLTHGTRVTSMTKPETIHDFGGFPQALFDFEYPALGSPIIAKEAQTTVHSRHVMLDNEWGLDHGTWSVLSSMYPKADIPVLQLSLDYSMSPKEHYALAKELKSLRSRGLLILGSGNVVHNLRALSFDGKKADWALEFDAYVEQTLASGDDGAIVDFQKLGALAKMAHPTIEHFLPLIYTLGVKDAADDLSFFNEGIDLGSISMRSAIYSA